MAGKRTREALGKYRKRHKLAGRMERSRLLDAVLHVDGMPPHVFNCASSGSAWRAGAAPSWVRALEGAAARGGEDSEGGGVSVERSPDGDASSVDGLGAGADARADGRGASTQATWGRA